MPKKRIDFDVVRAIALALPDVEESTIHGAPSLKVAGKLLACPALHSSAEPNSLAVRLDVAERAVLIVAEPSVYYVTLHYQRYPRCSCACHRSTELPCEICSKKPGTPRL